MGDSPTEQDWRNDLRTSWQTNDTMTVYNPENPDAYIYGDTVNPESLKDGAEIV